MKYFSLTLPFLLGLPLFVFAQEAATSTTGFVPLTNIPQLTDLGNAFTLDSFLNQLYRIAIGIAAIVAVLQIMRAGIMYMGGDSVTQKKEARDLIALSIGGLLLVLSPVIVFSIVNPSILSLKIDTSDLNTDLGRATTSDPIACVPACSAGQVCNGGACHDIPDPAGDALQCSLFLERRSVALAPGASCTSSLGADWQQASNSCCVSLTPGGTCCGRNRSAPPPPPESGAYYQLAVREQRFGTEAVLGGQYCIRYRSESFTGEDAFTQCGIASINATPIDQTPYVFTRYCSGETNPLTLELRDLPTCSP